MTTSSSGAIVKDDDDEDLLSPAAAVHRTSPGRTTFVWAGPPAKGSRTNLDDCWIKRNASHGRRSAAKPQHGPVQ